MNKFSVCCLLLLYSLLVYGQHSEPIILGKKETFYSKVLNETRRLWIYTPGVTAPASTAERQYPVMYVLDGESQFLTAVGIVQQLSQANGNGIVPQMMVVGIENTNRLRDLTPGTAIKPNPFVDFLSTELIPFIDAKYKPASYKILAGHSLGGLLALDVLTGKPGLFNACIAMDPSLWYEDEQHLNRILSRLSMGKMTGSRLFLGIANTLPAGMRLSGLKKDVSQQTQHIRSILRFGKSLRRLHNGLKYEQKYYDNEKHNTVPLLCTYDGLRFIYDFFPFNADLTDTSERFAGKLKEHYQLISEQLGYRAMPPEALISYWAYTALAGRQYPKAQALFKMNLDNYPDSPRVYEAYGDYLLSVKDTAKAISFYKKVNDTQKYPQIERKLNLLTSTSSFTLSAAELQRYAGVYLLEQYNISIVLELRNGTLWSRVQGQADSEFIPLAKDVFTVKNKEGYTITFQMNGDKPVSFTSVQPNGIFKATWKNELPDNRNSN